MRSPPREPDPVLLHPGQHVGRYEVVRRLGVGGIAEVWAVRHRRLGTLHALKVLIRAAPTLQERLVREGMVQARLHHPNIVPVRDVLDLEGVPGLLMPLIAGPSLGTLLRDSGVSTADAGALFRGIVAGVAHAHARGLVHRDLKPDNVLLDVGPTGVTPRVTDFGLVKDLAGPAFTQIGERLGTPAYAAPEQLDDAHGVDARADLFSLGVMLVELFAGHRPFGGDSLATIRAAHGEPPDLSGLSPHVAAVAADLLRIAPADRMAGTGVLLDRLRGAGAVDPLTSPALATRARALVSEVSTTGPATATMSVQIVPRYGVPRRPDRFVGRDAALATLLDHLDAALDDGPRLVTVTGPGGAGKTRLCTELAHGLRGDRAGVWWVDLVHATDAGAVRAALARALGVEPDVDLAEALRARERAVVVLDNFEQVADAASDTVRAWLEGTDDAVFVVTSRVPLRLRGEVRVPLGPLERSAAVTLFVDRAAAAGGNVDPDDPDLGALLDRLDDLPLAIELAAPRARLRTPGALLRMLDQRRRVLVSRSGDVPARHRTLEATLDWSWSLLDPVERRVLAACSVFEGGFTLQAAEAVLEADDPDLFVDDVVASLVDHSLLHLRRRKGQPPRLDMLVSVHAYARDRLEASGRAVAMERAHARWYGRGDRPIPLPGQAGRVSVPLPELDNLTAVVLRHGRHGLDEETARAAILAATLYTSYGPIRMSGELTERALDAQVPPGLRALVLAAHAHARDQNDDESGAGFFDEAVAQARRCGDEAVLAGVLLASASRGYSGARPEREELLREALALRPSAQAWRMLGEYVYSTGARADADTHFHRAKELAEAIGDPWELADVLFMLGYSARNQGRTTEATRWLTECIELSERTAYPRKVARALAQRSMCYAALGEPDRARTECNRSIAIHADIGDGVGADRARMALLVLETNAGRFEASVAILQTLRAHARRGGRRSDETRDVLNLATLRDRQGRFDDAEVLWREAEALLALEPEPLFAPVAPIFRAWGRLLEGDGPRALDLLDRAGPDLLPLYRVLRVMLTGAARRLVGDLAGADAALSSAVAEQAALSDLRLVGLLHVEVARLRADQGRTADAIAAWAIAIDTLDRASARLECVLAVAERGRLPGQDPAAALRRARELAEGVDPLPSLQAALAELAGRAT